MIITLLKIRNKYCVTYKYFYSHLGINLETTPLILPFEQSKYTNQNDRLKIHLFLSYLPWTQVNQLFHSNIFGHFPRNSKSTNMANRMIFCVKLFVFSYIIFCAQRHSFALKGMAVTILVYIHWFGNFIYLLWSVILKWIFAHLCSWL